MHEDSPASAARPVRWFQLFLLIVGVAALALVTTNVWLMSALVRQQQNSSQEHFFWVLCQPGSTSVEREVAFRHLVAAGNREWRAAELHDLNLAGWAMAGADLRYARFVRSRLTGADLSAAKLFGGNFESADLTGTNLDHAMLSESRLIHAVLKGANLRQAGLSACNLGQIDAESATFVAADLTDADCQMANLSRAKLMGANLSGAKLESAKLKGANLSLTRLEGADLTDTDFTDANWWRATGLTNKQLSQLKEKYAPTAAADQALKDDFAQWAAVPRPH